VAVLGHLNFKRRQGRERGATLVEAAIVLPLLLVVLMAIVEFGLAFKDNLSVGHGAREGARAGAAFGNDSHANYLILREVEGVLASISVSEGLRVQIYNPVSHQGDFYTYHQGFALGCDWNPCPDPDNSQYQVPSWLPADRDVSAPFTDRIAVRIDYTHHWLTNFFFTDTDFTKDVDFQIEPQVFDP
jgi:hypothetical protein